MALKNLSLSAKLWLLVSVAVCGMVAIEFKSLYEARQQALNARKAEIRHLVESAQSLIEASYKQHGDSEVAKEQAKELIRQLRYGEKGYFWVNDMSLRLIMHPLKPDKEGRDMTQVRDGSGRFHWQAMREQVVASGKGYVAYSFKAPSIDTPKDKLSYVSGFKPWGWMIGTGVYIDDIDEEFMQQLIGSTIVLLVAVVMVVLFSWRIMGNILQPVYLLQQRMQKASEGDLRQQPDDGRQDELGTLMRSFNTMLDKQAMLLGQLGNASGQLGVTVDELVSSTSQVRVGIQDQYLQVDQLAAAMDEMSATIQEVAGHAAQASTAVAQANDEAQQGHETVEQSIGATQALAESISNTSSSMHRLEEQCTNIGTVVDVINTISEQTNLLALNAAIEAARAGDQGRGFSVVADEVRSLAHRTQQSTVEIHSMIQLLQEESRRAISVMETSLQQSEDSVDKARQAGGLLGNIVSHIADINDMSLQIATAAEQQTAVADEMSRNLHSIRSVAQESSEVTDLLSERSGNLSGLMGDLDHSVSSFRV
ncbi:methyl-accepting chemotaxis protein [Marinobacterium jannaschii]|uniref:methyl-accepting chemotaxis protein n=1 Tax=Marinobacterium jannaschii TaxID=64970 RepID=UPI0006876DFF|nr:methyl-accepting chemotaxis protein [Marinobacterium jannaschii]